MGSNKRHTPLRRVVAVALAALLLMPVMAVASDLDVAVVDAESATVSELTLAPGGSAAVEVIYTVRGKQGDAARFSAYQSFALSGGSFVGSDAIEYVVAARVAQDPANEYQTSTTVTVPSDAAEGDYTLTIAAFGAVTTGQGKLDIRDTATITVHVVSPDDPQDTTPPTLSLPADITAEATSADGAAVTFACSATDDDGSDAPVVCSPASGSVFPLGSTMVQCSATDAAGNTANGSFVVTVVDTIAPALSVPADIVTWATSSAGAVVNFAVSATDAVDADPAIACAPASGSVFPVGSTTVQCSATDFSGNKASSSFTVRVVYAWSGVLAPINADGSSVFKAGSTVPVKFRLAGPSGGIADATAKIYLSKISNAVWGDETEAVSSTPASAGNLFRYSATDDLYIYNYGTKGLTEGTYRIRIDLGDGEARYAYFSLKR